MFSDANSLQLFEVLAQLIAQLSTQDNAVRAAAEQQLNEHWLLNQPQVLLAGLAYLMVNHPDVEIRSLTSILLRRMALRARPAAPAPAEAAGASVEDVSNYVFVGEETRQFVQTQLLQALSNEANASVRNKICDTVSELASHMHDKGSYWSELVQASLHFASSPQPLLRQTTFQIMAGIPSLFVNESPATIRTIFVAGIQDADVEVRLAALRAAAYYLIDAEPSARDSMTDLVPLMLGTLPPVLADPNMELSATDAIGYLIELAEAFPKLFRPVVPQVVEFMTSVMKNTDMENGVRQTCLELLLTLAEAAPGMMRKHAAFASTVIPIMLEWMSEHDEDEEWYQTEDLDDIDQESNETVGEQSMDRIARHMGGKVVLPIAFQIIPAFLSAQEWQRRHAALRCISAIGEGCRKIMFAELDKVVGIVLPHLRDPHPRVRHAACNAIGQMCTDFSPKIQEKFHEPIVTHLVYVIESTDRLRVQTYAAAALVNFAESASKECISPYLGVIIPKLTVLLGTGKTYAQEQAITTLATIADSANDKFAEFYPAIMPVLMDFLRNATGKELRSLRGKTMECATLIAMAVGKEVFAPNAQEFITLLQQTQASITEDDDPQSSFLLSAWARICKVLGHDFAPFMGFVLPPLYKSAGIKPDIAIFDDADPEEAEEWEMLNVNGQRIGIRTAILDEKCTAIEMLLCYAKELGPLFHEYVEKTMELVVPLLEFYFHDGVRYAAAAVIPLLLQSWTKAGYPAERTIGLWQTVAPKVLEAMKGEQDLELVSQLFQTFEESLDIVGPMSLNEPIMKSFIEYAQIQLEEYMQRAQDRAISRKDPDYDPEDEQTLQEEEINDDNLIDSIARAFRATIRNHRASYLPYFDQIVPVIDTFIASQDPIARRLALSVYQDIIEFAPVESVRYQPRFLERLLAASTDADPSVRQTAAFGVGIAAKVGGEPYRAFSVSALQNLFSVVRHADARSEDNTLATENAISAISKICRTYGTSGAFDLAQVLPHWFNALPIIEDEDEFEDTYSYLLDLIEGSHPAIPLSNAANLTKLVDIFTQVLAIPGFTGHDELVNRMLNALRRLLSQVDDATRAELWRTIPEDRRKMLTTKGYF
ncbi:armadillo-type protein [Entophlyctis helioformis]|nr:armadillo-type protein [Entophlyctis helioformis]